ncbi:MAG: hypothetical protein C0505_16370 [Leptothrix sp. (in: Bacteria)]|nr:hypothetical protein [Leptothrix sp. (in: b-proteobacteria)]
MKLAFWVRRTHKWIALIIGVQALLWMASGVYMTSISLDVIHGDHLVHVVREPLQPAQPRLGLAELRAQFPELQTLHLKRLLGKEVYEVRERGQTRLVDAATGAVMSPLEHEVIATLAKKIYKGEGVIRDVVWVTQAPQEVARRAVPMWAVNFDDRAGTTLYMSPQTGELLTRRHHLWRIFDFFLMLHIMDYDARTDVNNTLLRSFSIAGLLFALSGAWLVFYSFRKRGAR